MTWRLGRSSRYHRLLAIDVAKMQWVVGIWWGSNRQASSLQARAPSSRLHACDGWIPLQTWSQTRILILISCAICLSMEGAWFRGLAVSFCIKRGALHSLQDGDFRHEHSAKIYIVILVYAIEIRSDFGGLCMNSWTWFTLSWWYLSHLIFS